MSYWYIEGKDGRHYCYSKDPSFRCPMAEPVVFERDGEEWRTRLVEEHEPAVKRAAAALSMDPVALGTLIRKVHTSTSARRARDESGRLTTDCGVCGHRLVRLGFARWIEALPEQEDAQSRVAGRLGFSGFRQVEGRWYSPTKREAQEWARNRARAG